MDFFRVFIPAGFRAAGNVQQDGFRLKCYGDIFGGQPPGEGKRALHGVQQRLVECRAAALSRVKKDKIGVAPVREADGFF